MAFIALEKLHKLHDGYRQRIRLQNGDWLLLQENGQLHCISNQCPHMKAPLHNATVNGLTLRCALHGLEFNLRTGKPINSSSCADSLRFLPLVYEGNQVGVVV